MNQTWEIVKKKKLNLDLILVFAAQIWANFFTAGFTSTNS